MFAGVGFLLFALNDLLVDLIYFGARDRGARSRSSRAIPRLSPTRSKSRASRGTIAVFIPPGTKARSSPRCCARRSSASTIPITACSSASIATTRRPAAAIASVDDPRIEAVEVPADGPTTKADCLNHLYDALLACETARDAPVKAVVLHDAEDVVHPLELRIFDRLIDRAAIVQLPVLPLPDPASPWIAGHYCDEFAEAHIKELVVREAVGAAIPLAGVGCAIERKALARLAALEDGRPFAGDSMTEDYEMGLRIGALGLKTMFVRIPARIGERGDRRHPRPFPGDARRGGAPEGALARRDRAGRLGPARLERRPRRALDAAARPARAACRASCSSPPMPPPCCGRSCGWPKRSARRSRRGIEPAARHAC